MKDDLLRFAPVALPIAGFVTGLLAEALLNAPILAFFATAASLVGSIVCIVGGAVGLPGYASDLFMLDSAGGILTAAAAVFALLSLLISRGYLKSDDDEFPGEFSSLLALVPAGIGIVAGSRHAMMVFLGIELLSIPLYALVGLRRRSTAAIEGSLKYFLLGAFAAGMIAYGMSLLFASEHTLQLEALAGASGRSLAAAGGAALILAGLLFKISAAPFHFWTPDAYEGAPTPVTALMASSTKIAAVAGLLKLAPVLPHSAWPALAVISIITIAAGNLGALMQNRVKRMLAYSSVAHAGLILLALAAERSTAAGPRSAEVWNATIRSCIFYLTAYGASALGAFGTIAMLERGGERFRSLDDFRGLAKRNPLSAGLLAFFMLSLAGIPPTGGFWAKYYVFVTAINAGQIALAVTGIVLSVIGVAYYLRVIAICYMSSEEDAGAEVESAPPLAALLGTFGAATAVLVLGFAPTQLFAWL